MDESKGAPTWFISCIIIFGIAFLALQIITVSERNDFKKQVNNLRTAYEAHLGDEYIRDTCKIEVIEGRPRLLNPQDAPCIDGVRMRAKKDVEAIMNK